MSPSLIRTITGLILLALAGVGVSVCEADDHGDSPDTATLVGVGSITAGQIDVEGDQDYFRVNISTPGTHVFYTRGTTDTQGYLYDAGWNQITSDSDSGEDDNFRIVSTLNTGTYYVRVAGGWQALGAYELHVEGPGAGTISDDHGYSPWSATTVAVGSTTSGQIDVEGDYDYFKITLPSGGSYAFFSRGVTDTYGELYDSGWNRITTDSNSGEQDNFYIARTLGAGTYYVAVSWGGCCTFGVLPKLYELHTEGPGAGTISDDHGYSPWSATTVTVGGVTAGTLDMEGDADYFKITLPSGGSYAFFSRGVTDTYGELYDSGWNRITTDSNSGEQDNFYIARTLGAGTYYVAVSWGGCCTFGVLPKPYELHTEGPGAGTVSDDHGFSPWSATVVAGGSVTTGQLDTEGDVDYFRVNVTSPGDCLIYTLGPTDTYGELYDSGWNRITTDSNSGEQDNFYIARALGAGTYYVALSWGGCCTFGVLPKPYELHFDGPPPSDLVIENVTFMPASVAAGGNFTISFRVRNNGAGLAPATQARTRLSADRMLTRYDWPLSPLDVSISAIEPGKFYQVTRSAAVPLGTPPGQYYVGAFADSDNRGNQSDITNDGILSATQLSVTGPGVAVPVITLHPQGGTINAGESVLFGVAVSSTSPLRYQWKRNGSLIAGASNSTLALFNATPDQSGSYTVDVSNSGGTVTSQPAILMVNTGQEPNQPVQPATPRLSCLGDSFDALLPTVVITHGWQPGHSYDESVFEPGHALYWMTEMAWAIDARLAAEGLPPNGKGRRANIVRFAWREAFTGAFVDPLLGLSAAMVFTDTAGSRLALELNRLLGQHPTPIHLIGCSLGTLVNAKATSLLPWFQEIQVTILDAPLAHPAVDESTFHRLLESPSVRWVDNYIATDHSLPYPGVGGPITGAAPDGGLEVAADHETISDFYLGTMKNSEAKGFFFSSLLSHKSQRPAPQIWMPMLPTESSVLAEAATELGELFHLVEGIGESVTTQVEGQVRKGIRLLVPTRSAIAVHGEDPANSTVSMELTVPVEATRLAFEFLFSVPGDGDWLTASMNDTVLFSFRGDSFAGTNAQTASIPISGMAGRYGILAFTLHDVGPTNVDVTLSGVRFLSDSNLVSTIKWPPVLAIIPPQQVDEGSQLVFTATAADQDTIAEKLVFSLEPGVPAGANINSTNGLFTWSPTEAQGPSTNWITVRVTDDSSPPLSDTKNFLVVVRKANAKPTIEPITDQAVDEKNLVFLTVKATDSDQPLQKLTYSLEPGAPDGAAINSDTGAFFWRPTEAQGPSTNVIAVRTTDDGTPPTSSTASFTVTVREVNQAPVLDPIPKQTATVGQLLSVAVKASDEDVPANKLTYGVTNAPAEAGIDPVTGVFTWTPDAAVASTTNVITVTVTDDGVPALSDTKTFHVAVNAVSEIRLTAQMLPNGVLQIKLSGDPGRTYFIEASADFEEWTVVTNFVSATMPVEVLDPAAVGLSRRFYRAVSP